MHIYTLLERNSLGIYRSEKYVRRKLLVNVAQYVPNTLISNS